MHAYHTGITCANDDYSPGDVKKFDFDAAVAIMKETGYDMNMKYRESSKGGHAIACEINHGRMNNYLTNNDGDIDIEDLG